MKICENCGRECEDNVKICPRCGWGLKVAKVEEERTKTEVETKKGIFGEKIKLTKSKKFSIPLTNGEVISKNERYFKIYLYLPIITAILTALSFFVRSIVDAVIGGTLVLNSPIGSLFAWWGIGVLSTIIINWVMKVILAPIILHIYYLEEILIKLNKIK